MAILLRFEDHQKQIDYRKFVHALNWRQNQVRTFEEIKKPPKVKPVSQQNFSNFNMTVLANTHCNSFSYLCIFTCFLKVIIFNRLYRGGLG